MPIETRIQPRQTFWNLLYVFMCLGFALWGWYDYSVKIPRKEAEFAEYSVAEKAKSDLEKKVQATPLTDAEKTEYKSAVETLAKYKEKPAEPAAYDRAVQLWLWIVGCGVLGTPYFAIAQWRLTRCRYRLDDNGDLTAPEGFFTTDQLADIDMSRWMSRSIAVVKTTTGRQITLDDYKYKGVEDIVASLASRFHAGQWTSDARPIGDPKSRDTIAAAAKAAGSDAVLAAPAEKQGSNNSGGA